MQSASTMLSLFIFFFFSLLPSIASFCFVGLGTMKDATFCEAKIGHSVYVSFSHARICIRASVKKHRFNTLCESNARAILSTFCTKYNIHVCVICTALFSVHIFSNAHSYKQVHVSTIYTYFIAASFFLVVL